jgi:uncharacterized membrane protein
MSARLRRWRSGLLGLGLATAALLAVGSSPAAAAGPPVIDLGAPPGFTGSVALAVNPTGVVVGYSGGPSLPHATVWRPGPNGTYHAIDLGTLPGGDYSLATAISPAGVVAGSSSVPGMERAVVWTPDGHGGYAITDLGILADGGSGSRAGGIDSAGVVAGAVSRGNIGIPGPNFVHAAVWVPRGHAGRVLVDIGTLPGGTYSAADAINATGQVAGVSENGSGALVATVWRPVPDRRYRPVALSGPPDAVSSSASGIDRAGSVAGRAGFFGPRPTHAIVWRPAGADAYVATDLGALAPEGSVSEAFGIARGVVVGTAQTVAMEPQHAVAWRPDGRGAYRLVDLGTGPLPGAVSSEARGVNPAGLVVGSSTNSSANTLGVIHATAWRLAG